MIVVTGSGPRTGTSAMMRALGNPHSYAVPFPGYAAREMNPEGFYDIRDDVLFEHKDIPYEENTVIKLWGPQFEQFDCSKAELLVVMTRSNFVEHIDSIAKCARAEGHEPTSKKIAWIFKNQLDMIDKHFADTPKMYIDMEEFRSNPDYFITQIKEIAPCLL